MRRSAHASWVLAGLCVVAMSAGAAVVALRPAQPPQLAVTPVDSLNAGTALDRSLCLAFALVPGAASECANFRVTHALPASMSKGSVQVPTLLYNSAVAHPYPIVRTDVRYTSGTRPDSLEVILKVNGVERRRGMWSGTTLSLNVPRRLALGYDAIASGTGDSTGIYPYTLEIAAYVGGTKGSTTTVSGTLALVNRSESRLGPGWWLAGLEQLFVRSDSSLLWVGGDGSARHYTRSGGIWRAVHLTTRDSITLTSGGFTRFAKHGVRIRFNNQGNHIATVRRLGDSTVFRYDSTGARPQLSGITTLSGQAYVFHHSSGRLDSLTAPAAAGTTRRTRVTRAGGGVGAITSITDPDAKVVSFGYHATFSRRMVSRTDRRSTTTTFSYDGGWKVSQSSIGMSTVPDLVDQFLPAETRGLVAASGLSALADTALAYTRHDGPRSDVGDSTRFFLDLRFGAPRRILDALGNTTTLQRGDTAVPALVTRVQRANGHVQLARYTARGNLAVLIDSGGMVAGQRDSTRYEWNAAFDIVERIVPQLGDSLTRSIDTGTGNILWEQDRRGSGSRVTFAYETATGVTRGLLRAIAYPNATVDSFAYDAVGNLQRTRTPTGIVTLTYRDNLGRDTLIVTRIDGTNTQRQHKTFDLADQVTRETRVGSGTIDYSLSGSGLTRDTSALRNDTLVTLSYYDNEGNRTAVISSASAYVTNVGTDENIVYDRAHRPTAITTGQGTQNLTYDPAGNVTTHVYASGASVTQTFDALNRLTQRVLPAVDEIQRRCTGFPNGPISDGGVGPGCNMAFPYYPNNGTGYRLPADTSVFTYDAVGQLLTANNRYARIKRAYTLNGLLARDSLIFGTYTNPGTDVERRGQNYTYDRNGRRSSMAWEAGTTTYTYTVGSAVDFGPLQRVTDPGGNTYTLQFDALGRVDSLRVATSGGTVGVREKRTYDADGRLTLRERRSTNGSVGQLQLDSLTYSDRNTVDRAALISRAQPSERVRYAYDPLGGVVAQERVRLSDNAYQVQEFRNDAYGNVFYSRTRTSASGDEAPAVSDYFSDGLLTGRQTILPPPGQITQNMVIEEVTQQGTGGRVTLSGVLVTIPPVNGGGYASQTGSRYYYRADEKLGVVQRYDFRVGSSASLGSWEEYWYDALGRRILTRARRSGSPPTGNGNLCNDPVTSCQSYWQRTLWDGDQICTNGAPPTAPRPA
ncbi:RHS repeat domain-containing protein [Gemmatimonas sp.]